MDPLLDSSEQDEFKLLVHLGILSLGTACLLYNIGAFMARPERHLAVNAVLYSGLVGWEGAQIRRHWNELGGNHVHRTDC